MPRITPEGMVSFPCRRFQKGSWNEIKDDVAPETPLTLHFPGLAPKRLWAYPEELDLLALGHAALDLCRDGQTPAIGEVRDNEFWITVSDAPERLGETGYSLAPGEIMEAMAGFIAAPGRWEGTGCFHRAALFDPLAKEFVHRAEDIGRHNCIDRLAGYALRRGEDLSRFVLFVSARCTASLAKKAARAGTRMIVSRSAVTTAAIDAAVNAGVTLAGFARENRFTVFADPGARIS
jgi:FdhD protein